MVKTQESETVLMTGNCQTSAMPAGMHSGSAGFEAKHCLTAGSESVLPDLSKWRNVWAFAEHHKSWSPILPQMHTLPGTCGGFHRGIWRIMR